ncbi:PIR Superfamily Protein [Plasmodium ovale curtisi]|uniref:PIR Superfamily Protein n=1 Tax=Plasmodium ovale curtisi TaxID=864141 RepID=A0A1A8XC58_PLAOA|nr:PIR Superfamily Protein [Plasmodium ovale curtisi]
MGTEEDPDVSSLQSEVIYYQMDKGLKDYIDEKDIFWESVIKKHILNRLSIFRSLAKGFYYVCTMNKDEGTLYTERWNYLYFWTRHKVLKSSENSSLSDIMDLLKTVKSVKDNGQLYNNDMFNVSTEQFNNLKKIYDYLQNYDTIYLKVGPSGNAPCTEKYKKYLTTSYEFYMSEKGKCSYNNTDNYCKVLNSFVSEYGKKDIIKLTCNGTKDPNEKHEMEDDTEVLGSPGPQLSVHEKPAEASQTSSGPEVDTRHMQISDGIVSPSLGSINALSTVFPLLGTASLAFFFFKFTPIGSRLYNSISSKQIIRTNIEEPQELLENSYEFPNINIEENSHHISYHTM